MTSCLIDLSTINDETLPLVWFFVSILLTGNIIRLIYFAEKNKIKEQNIPKIKDTIVLSSGLLINLITLSFMKLNYSIESFKVYTEPTTWLYVCITTLMFGFLAWEFRCKGKKWLKDITSDSFSFCFGILFVLIAIVFIGNTISFIKLFPLESLTEMLINIISIIFSTAIVLFSGYTAKMLLSIKIRRYPKRESDFSNPLNEATLLE